MEHVYLLIKYIFLGIFQGFTEPIPISSSGHLLLLRHLFQIKTTGLSFEIFINLGSLIAVIIVYHKDITRLLKNSLIYIIRRDSECKQDFQYTLFLAIATIITGVIGLFVKDYIENRLNTVSVVGTALVVTGFALWAIHRLHGVKKDSDITVRDALIVGLAQAVALIPGISRSGATIVAAMLTGMRREVALRFSFLLYIPISFGVTLLSINDIIMDQQFKSLLIPYMLAFIACIIMTYFALKWFIRIMTKGKLAYFAAYCFIAGILVIMFMG